MRSCLPFVVLLLLLHPRNAYYGAGLKIMQQLLRAAADVDDTTTPFGLPDHLEISPSSWDTSAADPEDADAELAAAMQRIAEWSQLGVGDADVMYPETLDEFYEAFSDELQWRVAL
eukprot:jgi/Chrzof1/2840/Cz12g00220.t1